MTDELEQSSTQLERTFNGKAVRLSKWELALALAPMLSAFPVAEMQDDTFNAYYMMLCDVDAKTLALAVIAACQAHKYPTQLVTVAAIREQIPPSQALPGPNSGVERPANGRTKMYHDPNESKRERMKVMRQSGANDA